MAGQKRTKKDKKYFRPGAEAGQKIPPRTGYALGGFLSRRRKAHLAGQNATEVRMITPTARIIANMAFPESSYEDNYTEETRRELLLTMSWREILYTANRRGLTARREFASVSPAGNFLPKHCAAVRDEFVQGSIAGGERTTWIERMNIFGIIIGGVASAAIGFFQSPQFQSVIRTALKAGGTWIAVKSGMHADQQVQFVGQVVGFGLMGWGLILSAVTHSSFGSSITGTAAGPNAVQKAGE